MYGLGARNVLLNPIFPTLTVRLIMRYYEHQICAVHGRFPNARGERRCERDDQSPRPEAGRGDSV